MNRAGLSLGALRGSRRLYFLYFSWMALICGATRCWTAVNDVPTVDEAKGKLELLRTRGESADAFTFRSRHPPPSASARGEVVSAG